MLEEIIKAKQSGLTSLEVTRKVYFFINSVAFNEQEDKQITLFGKISDFFNIPYTSIQLIGSARTEKSLVKDKAFSPAGSDLDIAVIDTALFQRYLELAFIATNGWRDRNLFPVDATTKQPRDAEFKRYLLKGIFRPDLMPRCPEKANWENFFGRLSVDYSELCTGISAGIYMSNMYFEWKQKQTIEQFLANKGLV